MTKAIIESFVIVYTFSHMGLFIAIMDKIVIGDLKVFNFFNPIRNYRTWTSMNWFGVTLGTTFLHVLFPVYAVIYWFYKLCTFGRKQE